MPLIAPLPLEELPPDLGAAVESGRTTRMLSSTIPVQIWAHRPNVALAWLKTIEEMHLRGLLEPRLRELVRLKIASITACRACQVARKSDAVSEKDVACLGWDDPRYSEREQAALRYAELFAGDYLAIDEEVFAHLGRFFTTAEIVELNMFAALMLAGGRMTFVQRGYDEDAEAEDAITAPAR
ncbi:MAG: carboxymuconolactone decarboxylase family protein [Allosphingosinicella sp.]|uniref:carboxymuconolactone decarboxylase family protein n=1 Tax=Allosphingosinicella sp. TaxID=2823234 RepID=UPI00391FFED8